MANAFFEEATFTPQHIELATEALGDARVALMMEFRFLDTSLWYMPWQHADCSRSLATNGGALFFNPLSVLRSYMDNKNELVRDMLHLILHCILHHPFDSSHPDRRAWSTACDIAVENIVLHMSGQHFPCEQDAQRLEVLTELKEKLGVLTPQKLYRFLNDEYPDIPGVSNAAITKLQNLFKRDAHDKWAMWRTPEQDSSDSNQDPDSCVASFQNDSNADDIQEVMQQAQAAESDEDKGSPTGKSQGVSDEEEVESPDEGEGAGRDATNEQDEQAWKEMSEQVQVDLETFSKNLGDESGNLMANLSVANHTAVDYADFLRRFTTLSEECRINDDEFDYIFYTLGLQRFGNMPLVEPLEYQEVERIRDFVIAIDTSGSCSGALVRAFLQQTHDILCASNRFGTSMNVHIIQCDSRVQFDSTIQSIEEFEELENSFTLKGFGGTDFRPVFEYVEELKDKGQLQNLKGLIYFTDGIGTYPAEPPDYPVAFVFVSSDDMRRSVPPWAMKVVIDQDILKEWQ